MDTFFLMNDIALVSAVYSNVIQLYLHVSILFQVLYPFRLLQNIELSSLCYRVGPCWLSILNVTVQTPFLIHRFLSQSLFPYYICHSFFIEKVKESEVAQSCLTLCDPMACILPGSSIHGIFQARILEWVTISISRRSSQPRD